MDEKLTLTAGNNVTLVQDDNNLVVSASVDLSNYYNKSEVYNKSEAYSKSETDNEICDAISDVLPTYNGTIYADDFKCRNLLDINNITPNILISDQGVSNSNNAWDLCNEYVEIPANTKITFNSVSSGTVQFRLYEYDSSKTWIQRQELNAKTGTLTTSNTTAYVRFGYYKVNSPSNIQAEIGETATTYVPHKSFENKNIYTPKEVITGNWINGKPLYKQTFAYDNITKGQETFIFWNGNNSIYGNTVSNIDEVVHYEAYFKRSDNTYQQVPNVHSNMTDWANSIYDLGGSGFIFWVGNLSTLTVSYLVITIYYTKTTD